MARWLGWGAQGTVAVGLHLDAAWEGVFAQAVEVLEASWREMNQIFVTDLHAFGAERLNDLLQVDGVPEHDQVSHQIQRPDHFLLGFLLLAPNQAVPAKPQKHLQGVQPLALVELDVNLAAQRLAEQEWQRLAPLLVVRLFFV